MLNLPKVKKEVASTPVEDKPDLLFDISSNNKPSTEEVVIEQVSDGHLIAIETLDSEDIPLEDISTEEVVDPTFPQMNNHTVNDSDKEDCCDEKKIAPTLFIKSDTNVKAYLYADCEESVDTLIHILMQATEDVSVSVSICSPYVSVYTVIELVSALEATKAKVSINLIDIKSAIGLLLLIPKYEDITIGTGLVVAPIQDFFYGSTDNVKQELKAIESYNDLVYEALADNDILTEDEITRLTKKTDIIYISGVELLDRIK